MEIRFKDTIIEAVQGDITRETTDAIVNAANSSLLGGGGVDGAIHRAGGPEILEECQKIRARQGGCATGEAVITTAGRLPARYVIHTVGPVWNGGSNGEDNLLHNCYLNSLALANEHEATSISFPNISTGIYGYPKSQAADVAIQAVKEYVHLSAEGHMQRIRFVCYDAENLALYEQKLQQAFQ
ncbi:O-acetyl-ADP-ribose deacetylase [Paenibacillus dauci]|uniref:O-acetyl-ADP-ribose deacetylase n=1 Tax=Paenibacillus dauci TaxID=1567106 RepID=UPI00061909FD|nr:O-acetyl-ADP-ribose deacetylase [Paenibacillus dauci]